MQVYIQCLFVYVQLFSAAINNHGQTVITSCNLLAPGSCSSGVVWLEVSTEAARDCMEGGGGELERLLLL